MLRGSSADVSRDAGTLDVLFFQGGTIDKYTRSIRGQLPADLPPAREYWIVFRFERQQVPALSAMWHWRADADANIPAIPAVPRPHSAPRGQLMMPRCRNPQSRATSNGKSASLSGALRGRLAVASARADKYISRAKLSLRVDKIDASRKA